jgi:hypothetical protein
MTLKPFAALIAATFALSACEKRAETPATPAALPSGAAAEAAPPAAAQPSADATEASPLPAATKSVSVTPEPTPCGAEKLTNYLNLLPTSTAKDEIAKTVGHTNIRYVGPNDVTTREFRADRLTADLGVDGRVKRFHCG